MSKFDMKQSLHLHNPINRRPSAGASPADTILRSPSAIFWIVLHALCCLASLSFGFHSSRLVFFLLFSPSSTPFLHAATTTTTTTTTTTITTVTRTDILSLSFPTPPPPPLLAAGNRTRSRVAVGRHGIRIRPWPHPNPAEVLRAHFIIKRVQQEQRRHYSVTRRQRPLIIVTPTYARSFQALHLTGLLHSLLLVPYPLTWLVVEAAARSPHSGDTAALLARSGLPFLHIPFPEPMPDRWPDRRLVESRMRLRALRMVRERQMDGIVVFADDSNVHSLELFDEAQKVKWMGAVSIGILTGDEEQSEATEEDEEKKSPVTVPMQGPACNPSGDLIGWHSTKPPSKMEWAVFVMNSKSLWRGAEGKPDWVRDLDSISEAETEAIENPLVLLTDATMVEPLGSCGRKALLWWLRVEARSDSEFPPGWTLRPALDIAAAEKKRVRLLDTAPELLPSEEVKFSNKSMPSWTKYVAIMKGRMIH